MSKLKVFTAITAIAFTAACKHPIAIDGKGTIDGSGTRSGTWSNYSWWGQPGYKEYLNTDNDHISGAYNQTFIARDPDGQGSGWDFVAWENGCTDVKVNQNCTFNIGSDTVMDNYGKTMPTLVAVYGLNRTVSWQRPTQREDGQALSASDIDFYEITYTRKDVTGKDVTKTFKVNDGNATSYKVPLPRNASAVSMVTVDNDGRRSKTATVSI